MSIDNSTAKTSFFKSIGNWFNKNGNTVGKAMQAAGTTAMGAGMTGMFIDALNKPSSIFGCNSFGMYNPYMFEGYSPYSMMGMGGSLFGMGGMGCGCSTYMAAQIGYNYGAMMGMQAKMALAQNAQQSGIQYPSTATNPYIQPNLINNNLATTNTSVDTETSLENDTWDDTTVKFKASKLVKGEGDKKAGEKLDTKNDELFAGERKEVRLADSDDESGIKAGIIQSGKDMVAYLDTDNKDGFVDLDEYLENEKEKKYYNATVAERAFNKIDLNNDGKLDWTEFAAANGTFTTAYNGENTPTDSISKKNYKNWSIALGSESDNKFIKRMKAMRKYLIGEES